MKMNRKLFGALGWALFAVSSSALAASTQFSGEAAVVRANVLGNRIVLVDVGPLPAEGGAESETLFEYPINGLPDPLSGALQAQVLHAATVAQGNRSHSEASVANVDLSVAGQTISADFLMARATAECRRGEASVSGSSQIANLVINGTPVVQLEFAPNTTIDLVDADGVTVGRVVLNEQQAFADANFADMTVNALHVTIFNPLGDPPLADVRIASAHADIRCAGRPPAGRDFVTGGGWITGPSGAKANFGVAGGLKNNNALWGHLTYLDHGIRLKVKGTGVTAYSDTGPTSRQIKGTCEINGDAGTYVIDVSDNGEPGRNDTFSIGLSTGYTAAGSLRGGNIQLHK